MISRNILEILMYPYRDGYGYGYYGHAYGGDGDGTSRSDWEAAGAELHD